MMSICLIYLDRFKDDIECERIVLRAFLSPHLVATFRASKPDYFHQLLNEALGTGSGEGPDVGVVWRKTLVGGAKAAALVTTNTLSFVGPLGTFCGLISTPLSYCGL